jgi:tellurite resistance protein TehA-like permease
MTTIGHRTAHPFGYVTPNWFAAVMGTGIISVAATGLPGLAPGGGAVGRRIGEVFWLLSAALLVVICAATVEHWRHFGQVARRHHLHPVLAYFYGAVPMAALTVGAATLLAGRSVIGAPLAVGIDWILWSVGTIGGLVTYFAIPAQVIARGMMQPGSAFGGWLMPVVPPMVSASTGALLIPHAPIELRHPLLQACYLFFALSLAASLVVIAAVLRRLITDGIAQAVGPPVMVPTLWIILGPLGQSIAAANLLARQAGIAGADTDLLHRAGVDYGSTVWCLASLWIAYAARVTLRVARGGLPFALTWWSFTFPLGTYVTGSAALWVATGFGLFAVAAWAGFAALLLVWLAVALRTIRGIRSGVLLEAPA